MENCVKQKRGKKYDSDVTRKVCQLCWKTAKTMTTEHALFRRSWIDVCIAPVIHSFECTLFVCKQSVFCDVCQYCNDGVVILLDLAAPFGEISPDRVQRIRQFLERDSRVQDVTSKTRLKHLLF